METKVQMLQCQKCRSEKIRYSRTRSRWESWRRKITGNRPYRCLECHFRGWAPDPGPDFLPEPSEPASRTMAPDSPYLHAARAWDDRPRPDVDLAKLDETIATPAAKQH